MTMKYDFQRFLDKWQYSLKEVKMKLQKLKFVTQMF